MDIHAPEGPTRSFRDFAIHIVIVTIGILIALGLEGLCETIHVRHQLREMRELSKREVDENLQQLARERGRTQETLKSLNMLLVDYPTLSHDPAKLRMRLEAIQSSAYFFTALTWETELSTGVLGHMSTTEVMRQAGMSISVKTYSTYQAVAVQQWDHAQAFFQSRTSLTPATAEEGLERLEQLHADYQVLDHLQKELENTLKRSEP